MIFCPACSAENPDGTKICVKCGTELPKTAAFVPPGPATRTRAVAQPENKDKYGARDMGRDMVDALWLIAILVLLLVGFLGEMTHWTFRFTETDQAKLVQTPVLAAAKPRPAYHHHAVHHATRPLTTANTNIEQIQPVIETGNPDSLYAKGKQQFDDKNYRGSFLSLKKALEIDPTYAKAYFALGYLYARFDMNDAAVRMYEMALRFNPQFSEPINNLAIMYQRSGNLDDALALLQQAVTMDGNNADFEFNLGDVYLDKNQPEDALSAFQKASNLRPDDASIYDDMALTYERLGKKQEAEDSWQKVLQYATRLDFKKEAKKHLDYLQSLS
jgi:Flp pilus assembly protein TadD